MQDFPERDWKLLSSLKPTALNRYCTRVLEEIKTITTDTTKSPHERYLALFALIHERDSTLASAFNGLRRSTAFFQLAQMRNLDLFTEEELHQFSHETLTRLNNIRNLSHRGDASTPRRPEAGFQ